jgi:hypothetical protein
VPALDGNDALRLSAGGFSSYIGFLHTKMESALGPML